MRNVFRWFLGRARNAEHWGQFVLARTEAQRVYASMVLQGSRIMGAPGIL